MLDATAFKLVPIGTVPGGHLVVFEIADTAYVALRVTMPDHGNGAAAGTLNLRPIDQPMGQPQLMVYSDMDDTWCIDLGPAVIRVPADAIGEISRAERSRSGDLLVGPEGAGIAAVFGRHPIGRGTWAVSNGTPLSVSHPCRRFTRWEIGVMQGNAFQAVAAFLDREA